MLWLSGIQATGRAKLKRVTRALKFLLFLEENPKHRVMTVYPFMIVALILGVWISSIVILKVFAPQGLMAVIVGLLALDLSFLEAVHILRDR